MTWVKICGITNLQDARLAVEAGADAIGFVFYRKSPRKIEAKAVRAIVEKISEPVEKVGVFVDETPTQIHETVSAAGLTAVQLQGRNLVDSVMNGAESPAELLGVGKVIAAVGGESLKTGGVLISQDAPEKIFALLFDSQANGVVGGTGTAFDWQGTRGMIQVISLKLPVIVAGGLTAGNVTQAIRLLKPFGVDVSSGVEAKPGKKDPAKIAAFVQAVRSAGKTA